MIISKKIRGTIQLFRPELPFAAGVCVILGEIIALGSSPPWRELLLGFACGFFLSGAALTLNDYFDIEVDKVNAPQRPIPAGLLTPSDAIGLTAIATLIGLVTAFFIGPLAFIVSAIFWVIGALYNWRYKASGIWGNLMVAASVGITFVLGGIAVGQPMNKVVWSFGLIAFLIDLAEEIAGDAMDMEGDRKRGSKSIALTVGRDTALRITGSLFVLVVLLSYVPFVLGWLEAGYLLLVSAIGIVVLLFTIRLVRSQTPQAGRSAMRGIYLSIVFGMIVFIGSQFLV
ncbi:MAG: prenyltransferase [Chloroflexi bacterium]|nr:MAG: prenyltransferase [Chloroflexota bacterium]